jgi:hypothetical protein
MTKKVILICLIVISSLGIKSAFAQSKGFGLGVVLGEPTGLAGKYWLENGNAIDFGLGYAFSSNDSRVNLHVDYLFHNYSAIRSAEKFVLFYGVGGRIVTSDNKSAWLGLRGVIGIDWFIKNAPIDVFLEAAPVFDIAPNTGLDLDAGLGVRFFF